MAKILGNFLCGLIAGCILSMVPFVILVVIVMLIPGGNQFDKFGVAISYPIATVLSIVFFYYLSFARESGRSGPEDDSSRGPKRIIFVGEVLGSFSPIAIWLM